MAKIVLAHGFLGFGQLAGGKVDYFNGIKAEYARRGHEVLTPSVPPLGSIRDRSLELATQIGAAWGRSTDDIYMIGHSMGGLDCRRVIATDDKIGARVPRLVTICTPHYGSPVATAVLKASGPLWDALPFLLQVGVRELFRGNQGALEDLTERSDLQDGDRQGVEYLRVGARPTSLLPSWLFTVSRKVLKVTREENDGVVTLSSAAGGASLFGEPWPVDHGGAVGWPTDVFGAAAALAAPDDHVERYVDLLGPLLKPRVPAVP